MLHFLLFGLHLKNNYSAQQKWLSLFKQKIINFDLLVRCLSSVGTSGLRAESHSLQNKVRIYWEMFWYLHGICGLKEHIELHQSYPLSCCIQSKVEGLFYSGATTGGCVKIAPAWVFMVFGHRNALMLDIFLSWHKSDWNIRIIFSMSCIKFEQLLFRYPISDWTLHLSWTKSWVYTQ